MRREFEPALAAVAVLILVNAAAGVIALATGASNGLAEAGWRVIFTTVTLTAAGFALLPCVVAWESGRLGHKPWLAAAICVCNLAAVSVIIAGIWNFCGVRIVLAAGGHRCRHRVDTLLRLSSLARGPPRRTHWLRLVALAFAALLASEVVATIWNEDLWSDAYIRALGITAILMLTASILLPVVQRISRQAPVAAPIEANFCPACGVSLSASAGAASCPGCGARFRIEFLSTGGAGA